jgi:hypothetical protein
MRYFIASILATLILLIALIANLWSTEVLTFTYWQEGGTNTSRSEAVRNLGLLAVAFIGLGFGIWRAYTAFRQTKASQLQAEAANEQAKSANEQAKAANEQARIAEQGQFTDRFSKAVEQLGNETLPVRLGGIFALWRLAKDSPENDLASVLDILCSFVRKPTTDLALEPAAKEGGENDEMERGLRPDVQAILNLIGDKDAVFRKNVTSEYRISFSGANLAVAELTLNNLSFANLSRAILSGANLRRADLWENDLRDADLSFANLRWAKLIGADLSGASLRESVLRETDLRCAYLIGANLSGADLSEADLSWANLNGADLSWANLNGADLIGANLSGTDLSDAYVLTQTQLDVAFYDGNSPPQNLPKDPEGNQLVWRGKQCPEK